MALSLQGLSPLSLHSRNYIYSDSLVFVSFHKSLQFSPAKNPRTLTSRFRIPLLFHGTILSLWCLFCTRRLTSRLLFPRSIWLASMVFALALNLLQWVLYCDFCFWCFSVFCCICLCCSALLLLFFIYVTWLCFNTDYLNLVFFLFWFFLGTLYYFLG